MERSTPCAAGKGLAELKMCQQEHRVCQGSLVFTFRENIAHAQDSHQVVNITVDALGNSRILQDRIGEDSVET